jgi:hypothetical protein
MRCPTCKKRRIATHDTVCRTCRRLIAECIDPGHIPWRTVPMVADVLLVRRRLGVSSERAVQNALSSLTAPARRSPPCP